MDTLILFVKSPEPGAVKTRLASAIGPDRAAALYRVLAEAEVAATAPAGEEYRRLFFFAPAAAQARLESWFPGETFVPQADGDLGDRMAAAFEESHRRGAGRAVIIGSDVPWVSRELVIDAFAALAAHDVVVGPARDGGYYLLALRQPRPELLRGIAWSTSRVLKATVEKANALRLSVHRLVTLPDIDTPEDVRREWSRLAPLLSGSPLGRELERLLVAED
jgi:rSAM/selenodomain-associated transferase 1